MAKERRRPPGADEDMQGPEERGRRREGKEMRSLPFLVSPRDVNDEKRNAKSEKQRVEDEEMKWR